jgi:Tol biopolymer transport system component
MDTQTVPSRLQHHLQAGERIWWVGRPDLIRSAWRRALRALAWGFILGLLAGEALAFWEIAQQTRIDAGAQVALGYNGSTAAWLEALRAVSIAIPWNIVLGVGLGAAVVLFAWDLLWASGKLYAITGRSFLWFRWWGTKARQIPLEEALHLEVTQHPDGTGTLFFPNVAWVSFDSIVGAEQVANWAWEAAQQAGFSWPGWRVGQHLPSRLFLAPGCSSLVLMGVALLVSLTGATVLDWQVPVISPGLAMVVLVLLLFGSVLAAYQRRGTGCKARLAQLLMGLAATVALVTLVPVFSALLGAIPRGAEAIRLTTEPAEDRFPAWSPDGRQVAFASDRANGWDIWVLDVRDSLQGSGEDAVTLLADAGSADRAPAWSPDGRKIAFVSLFSGGPGGTEERIYGVRPDGRDLSLLWPDVGSEAAMHGVTLSWSPDSHSLVYGGEIIYEITVDGLAGSHPQRIVAGYTPDLSPDGTRLAYAVQRSEDSPFELDIQVKSVGGTSDSILNVTRTIKGVRESPAESHDPEWAPDGRKLALVTGVDRIYVVDVEHALEGGGVPEIAWGMRGRDPAWSPDGEHLAFAAQRDGNWDLYVAAAEPADPGWLLSQRGVAALAIVALLVLTSGQGAGFTLLVALTGSLVGAVLGSPGGIGSASEKAISGAFWGAWAGFMVGTVLWLGLWTLYASWSRRMRSSGMPSA